jgi:hypothetical protein
MKNILLFIFLVLNVSRNTVFCSAYGEDFPANSLIKRVHFLAAAQRAYVKYLRMQEKTVDQALQMAQSILIRSKISRLFEDKCMKNAILNSNGNICIDEHLFFPLYSLEPIVIGDKQVKDFQKKLIHLKRRSNADLYRFHDLDDESLAVECSSFPRSLAIAYRHKFCLEDTDQYKQVLCSLNVENEDQAHRTVKTLTNLQSWLSQRIALIDAQRRITQSFIQIKETLQNKSLKTYREEQELIFFKICKLIALIFYCPFEKEWPVRNIYFKAYKRYFLDLENITNYSSGRGKQGLFLKGINCRADAEQQYNMLKDYAKENGLEHIVQFAERRSKKLIKKRLNNKHIGYLYHFNPGF